MKPNIDFIKWCCKYADGFGWTDNCKTRCPVIMPNGTQTGIDGEYWIKERFPLLLQRAIEGVNREFKMFMIRQNRGGIEIFSEVTDDIQDFYFLGTHDCDQAKQQALMYVMERD